MLDFVIANFVIVKVGLFEIDAEVAVVINFVDLIFSSALSSRIFTLVDSERNNSCFFGSK